MIYDVKATNIKGGDSIEFQVEGDTESDCLRNAQRKADEIFPMHKFKITVQLTKPQIPVFPEGNPFKEG